MGWFFVVCLFVIYFLLLVSNRVHANLKSIQGYLYKVNKLIYEVYSINISS